MRVDEPLRLVCPLIYADAANRMKPPRRAQVEAYRQATHEPHEYDNVEKKEEKAEIEKDFGGAAHTWD